MAYVCLRSEKYKSPEYKAASRKGKEKIRMRWAQGRWEAEQGSRQKSESWTRVDTSKGAYRSFGWLWREEGGTQTAYEDVCKFTKKCVAMGPPWVKYCDRWEHLRY